MEKNQTFSGPNWDNSKEYNGLDSSDLVNDLNTVKLNLEELMRKLEPFAKDIVAHTGSGISAHAEKISDGIAIAETLTATTILLQNISTYCSCILSVQGDHEGAKKVKGQLMSSFALLGSVSKTHTMWLTYLDENSIALYLKHPTGQEDSFRIQRVRSRRDYLLSLPEEDVITHLELDGPDAFGNLYTDISSTMTCLIQDSEGNEIQYGMAQASTLLESSNEKVRKDAYKAINNSWSKQVIPCSAVINALSGWRLSVYRKRSHSKPLGYLDEPLFNNCIEKQTLETMFQTIKEEKLFSQSVLKRQAELLNLKTLGPWDKFAPFPVANETKTSFADAITLIKEAFATVDSSMADFVQLMVDNRWIEGSLGPKKRPGAYCTKFTKSRTPRVYLSYSGGMKDVVTLAHELGHAYHNWVMKDIPITATRYPMTLAETASIFAQTLVMDHLLKKGSNVSERRQIQWSIARDVEGFLLNIPVRFDFENRIYTERADGPLSHQRLCELMKESWEAWYGDCLIEYDELFWASKLHFHLSGTSFYNFPYSFGYLFAVGVYAQKDVLGAQFIGKYKELLRDTGRFTAEQVAQRYLEADLSQPNFWHQSINQIKDKLKGF